MSMSFDRDLTNGQQEILDGFFKDKGVEVAAKGARNVLFEAFEMKSKEMGDLARELKQPVTVELYNEGEIKTMSDETKYKATNRGWKKI